ncbi:hypothetical protein V2G26_016496 [Clonostachys chloroleuca]
MGLVPDPHFRDSPRYLVRLDTRYQVPYLQPCSHRRLVWLPQHRKPAAALFCSFDVGRLAQGTLELGP